ncbi:hypothetical protein Tco_0781130 [Tanacetum coccineum]
MNLTTTPLGRGRDSVSISIKGEVSYKDMHPFYPSCEIADSFICIFPRVKFSSHYPVVHHSGHDIKRGVEVDSSRVPVPLPEDPYEAIRQAYLDRTNTESEPFEDPIDTETLELPLSIALPISLSESTPPILVPILCRTARMVMRVPHTMSSDLSASMVEVAVEDSEEEDDEEDEESMDSDSLSEDAEDEGPTAEDKDLVVEDEGLTARVEGPGMDDESYGLDSESHGMDDESRSLDDEGHSVESDGLDLEEKEEVVPGGQQQEALVVGTVVSAPLRLGYVMCGHRRTSTREVLQLPRQCT